MLVEGLGSASVANGLMRVEVLERSAKGEDVVGGVLLIPANRVQTIIQGLQGIVQKVQAATAAQAQPAETEVN